MSDYKRLTQYVKETYDMEREKMDKAERMEMELQKSNPNMHSMNKDILMAEYEKQQHDLQQEEHEINDLSGLAEDDDYGDNDGDEYY